MILPATNVVASSVSPAATFVVAAPSAKFAESATSQSGSSVVYVAVAQEADWAPCSWYSTEPEGSTPSFDTSKRSRRSVVRGMTSEVFSTCAQVAVTSVPSSLRQR